MTVNDDPSASQNSYLGIGYPAAGTFRVGGRSPVEEHRLIEKLDLLVVESEGWYAQRASTDGDNTFGALITLSGTPS